MTNLWDHQARPVRVVDGDTLDLEVDTSFNTRFVGRFRLKGVDTHETHNTSRDSDEYRKGVKETAFTKRFIEVAEMDPFDWPLIVTTKKAGKYGRWLATVKRRGDGAVLNQRLIEEFDGIARD